MVTMSTCLEDNTGAAIDRIAGERRWSISQTISVLLEESSTLRKAMKAQPEPVETEQTPST